MHGVLMIMLRYLDRIVKRSLVLMPLFLSACYVLYLLNGLHRFSAEQRPGDFGIVLARHTMATYHEIHKVSTLNQRSTVTMDDGLLLSNSFTTWKEGLVSNVQPVVTRNCSLLFSGDKNEIKRVKQAQEIWYDVFALELEYLELSYNCDWVRSQLGNNLFYISEEEREFPIAFALVVHENAMQIFRFLKVIYRPHNVYCIHIDTKASDFTKTFLYNIANCMHNIFIPLKLLSVIRGHGSSVFEAQMSCLRDLRHSSALAPWKYVITLCGKEIPLTTNREIVCRLKGLGGVSALNAVSMPKRLFFRINNLLPIPGNVTVYKGLMYHSLSRNFVEFLFENFTAINLYNHLIKGHIPEEHVLATLYMLPGVPGGFQPALKNLSQSPITRFIWVNGVYNFFFWRRKCNGWKVHDICILSSGDLWRLKYVPVQNSACKGPLFHDKYFMERDHVIMDCMEEELVHRNTLEFQSDYQLYNRKLFNLEMGE